MRCGWCRGRNSWLLFVLLLLIDHSCWWAGVLRNVAAFNNNNNNNNEPDDDVIVLGHEDNAGGVIRYEPPFDESSSPFYTPELVRVLQRRRPRRRPSWHADNEDPMEEAAWLVDLGLAHRSVLEEAAADADDDDSSSSSSSSHLLAEHERRAIFALDSAIQIYKGQLMDLEDERNSNGAPEKKYLEQSERSTLDHHLAAAYFSLAETFTIAPDPAKQKLALDYYLQAHRLFQQLLQLDASYLAVASRREIEVSDAHCSLRLGVALLNSNSNSNNHNDGDPNGLGGAAAATMETVMEQILTDPTALQDLMAGVDADGDLTDWLSGGATMELSVEQLQKLLQGSGVNLDHLIDTSQRQLQRLKQAEGHFKAAAQTFRRALRLHYKRDDDGGDDDDDELELEHALAMALHNLGTTAVTRGNLAAAAAHNEEALKIYETTIVPKLLLRDGWRERPPVAADDTCTAVSEVLYTLSDIYLQLGQYDRAKEAYKRSMQWNEKYDLEPPLNPLEFGIMEVGGDPVVQFEQALQQYREMFSDEDATYDEEGYFDQATGQTYYEKDDGYEADLHANIGALLMARGGDDHILAATHLLEAVRLYGLAGEPDGQNMASVKFNLAALHLRNGDYRESARLHGEALDLFRKLNGENVDPMGGGFGFGGGMGLEELTNQLLQQRGAKPMEDSTASDDNDSNREPVDTQQRPFATASIPVDEKDNAAKTTSSSGPTMFIDLTSFLHQNDTKDEL